MLEDSSNGATPDNNVMALGTTIGFLLDGPRGREHVTAARLRRLIHPLTELELEMEPAAAGNGGSTSAMAPLRVSACALVSICRSWSGLLSLAADRYGLRALLACVLVPPVQRGLLIVEAICTLLSQLWRPELAALPLL